MEWLGKWSMLDVLVLALMIFYIKSNGIADASSQPGIYFFFGAVLLTMLAHGWVKGPEVAMVPADQVEPSVSPQDDPPASPRDEPSASPQDKPSVSPQGEPQGNPSV